MQVVYSSSGGGSSGYAYHSLTCWETFAYIIFPGAAGTSVIVFNSIKYSIVQDIVLFLF